MFVHLHCHSTYSFLAGVDSVEALAEAAARMGMPALALTDTHGLYGAIPFYRAACAAGLRPLFGAVLSGAGGETAVLLAEHRAGFGALCRAITAFHLDPEFTLAACLETLGSGVIVLCPHAGLLERVARRRGAAGLYAELVRPAPLREQRRLVQTARRCGVPLVATNRVFFIRPEDWAAHRLAAAIRTRTTVDTLPAGAVVPPEAWLKPPALMARLFEDLPEAVANTVRIAERCRVTFELGRVRLPPFDPGSGGSPGALLHRLCARGLRRLYPGDARAERRLREELRVIDALRFHAYFLIVWDIVREARRRGIPTVGRGSAANSLVCRLLGITQVDPLRHRLYFERFLNLERSDYPDIDLDFPWNRRDEMLDYVFDTHGHDRVALIATHVHFRARSLVRETGKALGLPLREIERFTRPLPHSGSLAELETVRATVPECRDLPVADEPYRTLLQRARRLDGHPRHLSLHCGGIVISPQPITGLIPLETTPKGFAVTQYDMYPVEDMGLLKIDLLAQKGLAVLSDTVADVRAHYGTALDFDRIDPVADAETRALVAQGRTIGCFYIESPGMRNLLQKLNVQSFEMLTAASSIIRPGVSDSGMMRAFIDRHNGRAPVTYAHPKLEPILRDTFGVMIYQEDVIKVAHAIAGMSLGEAEGLRKCMSKKRDWQRMETWRERFLSGARARGVADATARELWRQMESFAGYAFCKAHSASFALLSYQTAYLKAHYPAEFMAAVLSNRGGFYDTCAYAEEARRLGLRLLPPDVQHSADRFTAERDPAGPGAGRAAAIRVGLSQIKGLSGGTIRRIVMQRRRGRYTSLADFLERARPDQAEAETLIRCGALDSLGASRPALFWELLLRQKRRCRAAQAPLFAAPAAASPALPVPVHRISRPGRRERLTAELECLDLTVGEHLLGLYADRLRRTRWPRRNACDLQRHAGGLITLAGWLITAKRTRTVRQEVMKFITLEDATGLFEVTLFPRVYRRFGHLLYDRGPYLVRGRVEREGACCTVNALWLGRI